MSRRGSIPTVRSSCFWLNAFTGSGQFHATYEVGQQLAGGAFASQLHVQPTTHLQPAARLYRAAPDHLSGRWSWTTELEAAQHYQAERGDGSKIWTCVPGRVFGRIDNTMSAATGFPAKFTEWVVQPTGVELLATFASSA